jgi:hypothetical protein
MLTDLGPGKAVQGDESVVLFFLFFNFFIFFMSSPLNMPGTGNKVTPTRRDALLTLEDTSGIVSLANALAVHQAAPRKASKQGNRSLADKTTIGRD